ncbi:type II toxin-antitoxin system RelE/ParE family toxin [bacterium]|nr:type II toxin-antitoxin system RelE/ParE family toxin [bacterium]
MLKNYKLVPTKLFLKNLKKLDFKTGKRVMEALQELIEDPYRGKKLVNREFAIWRIRVGEYRIRYDIESDSVILYLVKHRKDIYKGK